MGAKARTLARRDEGDNSGLLRQEGRLARRVFGGIRKLMSVAHRRTEEHLGDGDDITYSEIVVADREALDKLIRDEDVEVLYAGRHNDPADCSYATPCRKW